ncbi:TonB-dependent receptor [Echinimonas agarilytica]|uniref:TonB-dependent receptor n=1 Tax=Echinimonas agarilytica TaxID=1215918 RepID=A0AA41W3S2_9GAMM|nr:TonB-dependent receptor [Echinimonas agarilytica]MCM2678149.1 TonB-dependent receptor [Echinimonas agarilytica]
MPLNYIAPDAGDLIKKMPGAAINRNGPLTPIAQHRGLYGDRVAVSIDGSPVIGAGPNAMDTPLSYAPTILIQSLQSHRGIAPVSSAIETLGGAYDVKMREFIFNTQSDLRINGTARLGYQDNGQATSAQGVFQVANEQHGIQLFIDVQQGDSDLESGNGHSISPTEYEKWVGGASYHYALDSGQINVSWQHFDTDEAGTPALPMDIQYIETDRFALNGNLNVAGWQTKVHLGYTDAEHLMDNYSQRVNGMMMDMTRDNLATSDDINWTFSANKEFNGHIIELGTNGIVAHHDATITDPKNGMFKIANFNDVEDNKASIYGTWTHVHRNLEFSTGARLTYAEADAGDVSHSMAMMNPMIMQLVDEFNASERDQDDWLYDVTAEVIWTLNSAWSVSAAAGQKQRAPTYQERYLWFPLEATAGLADGYNYIGNPHLNAEQAWQFDTGMRWQGESSFVEPHLFYHRIDDYIQGIPSPHMAANMVSTAMTGKAPLQFANVDAELYGFDIEAVWHIARQWTLEGTASYVRGKRRDMNDDLYRIAPPSLRTRLSYDIHNLNFGGAWNLVAKKEEVAAVNAEQKTSGYGTIDLDMSYGFDRWLFSAGVENLFDKGYQDHLAGYNRVMMSDLPIGSRIEGIGRNVWANIAFEM